MSQKQKNEEVDWAYSVIDSFKEGFDRVKSKPEKGQDAFREFLLKFGDLLEAVMILTEMEHRMVIYELAKSYLEMVKAWAKK